MKTGHRLATYAEHKGHCTVEMNSALLETVNLIGSVKSPNSGVTKLNPFIQSTGELQIGIYVLYDKLQEQES